MFRTLVILLGLLVAVPAIAVQPDEILDDPVLEERARNLSAELRCMVCQNQSIDDSDASVARDLRLLVRERLVQGDTDRQVLDYMVERYGEFVLLKPRLTVGNALLWAAPVLLLLGGASLVYFSLRRRKDVVTPETPLSEEEQEKLKKILS